MTAILDKVAAGELIGRRQDMATNQLLSHALEQLLARSKRLRDTEAATMNMRLGGLRSGRAAGASLVRGAGDDLRTWRQPYEGERHAILDGIVVVSARPVSGRPRVRVGADRRHRSGDDAKERRHRRA